MAALSSTTPDQKKPNTTYKYYPNVLELAAKCQVLIVVCSLTPETHHIVNREVMDALSPNGVLINIGHGLHVNESKLVKVLVEGRLGGFGIDVFEQEPYALEELFDLENVVLLPYVSTGIIETHKAMADLVLGNLDVHFTNEPLLTHVI